MLTAAGSTGTPYNLAEANTASSGTGYYNVTYSGGTSNNGVLWQLGMLEISANAQIPDIFCQSQGLSPQGGQCAGPISAYFSWQGPGSPPVEVSVDVFSYEVATGSDSTSQLYVNDGFGLALGGTSPQVVQVGSTWFEGGEVTMHTYYITNPGENFEIPDAYPQAAAGIPGITTAWFTAVYAAGAFPVQPPVVNIVSDTNRDGQINAADQNGRGTFKPTSGAIYNVNFGRNNTNAPIRDPSTNPAPPNNPTVNPPAPDKLIPTDSLTFGFDGAVANEDTVINGTNDMPNITPFQITVSNQTPGWRYFLMTDDSSVRAIHVFPSISANAQSVLGGPTSTMGDTTPGTGACLQTEITSYIPKQSGETITMGLEGLAFAGMQILNHGETYTTTPAANPTQQTFNGMANLTIEARLYAQDGVTILQKVDDNIELGVAPFILHSNVDQSVQVWAANSANPSEKWTVSNQPLIAALTATGQLNTGTNDDLDRWYQDCCEIGYTYRPGQAPRDCVFELPHSIDRPFWVQNQLLNANTNLFYLGSQLFPNNVVMVSGDYGGNLDCIPPSPAFPLGEILVGNTCSAELMAFLNAQVVQPVITIPTSWLDVGHVDEVLQFVPGPLDANLYCVIASPSVAQTDLGTFTGNAANQSGFFAAGTNASQGATVIPGGTGLTFTLSQAGLQMTLPGNKIISSNTTQSSPWTPTNLWVVMTTGAAQGFTFQVSQISQSGVHLIGSTAYMAATSVMNIPTGTLPGTPYNVFGLYPWEYLYPLTAAEFSTDLSLIQSGDQFMVVDGMEDWNANNTGLSPSGVSVAELIGDPVLTSYNTGAQSEISAIEVILGFEAGGATVNFITVPTLYERAYGDILSSSSPYGVNPFSATDRSGFAFTPGIANLQVVGAAVIAPSPLGPAVFTNGLSDLVSGLVLADDWEMYHTFMGEIHCGTNVRRQAFPNVNWWKLLTGG